MARLSITKCQGTGNDFVLLDNVDGTPYRFHELAKTLCDRHFGVGADGLIATGPSATHDADLEMRIFNADGTEAEMCGNGVRCVARYCFERRSGAPKSIRLRTRAGLVRAEVVDAAPASFAVRVAMGVPESIVLWEVPAMLCGLSVLGADVLIGNPHRVIFVDVDPKTVDLEAMAAEVASENDADDETIDDVNVEVARVVDGTVDMRVHERGVGETLACGTGATAAALAAILAGAARSPAGVSMRGGDVVVEWAGPGEEAYLTGGAELVFRADVEVPDAMIAAAGAVRA